MPLEYPPITIESTPRPSPMHGKMFISYRRADTGPYAQLVHGALAKHFGEDRIFLDVDEIAPGQNFVQVLDRALSECSVLIVLIGPQWLSIQDPESGARRLDNPQDFVRLEVATAIKRHISIIPLLINGAHMPGTDELPEDLKPLHQQQAFKVGERVNRDVENDLVPAIQRTLEGMAEERRLKMAKYTDEYAIEPFTQPHAFVIMPWGKKKGRDGSFYDFNAIYVQLIKPAVEEAGFSSFRSDPEISVADFMTDMFQEMVLADLCVADLSIDDANVFYELGIRHAVRKSGAVHLHSGRAYMPLETFNVHTIQYHITPDGVPDPAFIERDRAVIGRACRDLYEAAHGVVHSPVFELFGRLPEPGKKELRTSRATGFWREYTVWKNRVTAAEKQGRIGDILLLTDEIHNPIIREEVVDYTASLLRDLGYNNLALYEFRQGLAINPRNDKFRREEALRLYHLGQIEAIASLEAILRDNPADLDAVALLGRLYEELWSESWKGIGDEQERIQEAYYSYPSLIKSIETFLAGYNRDQNHWRLGGQALLWMTVLTHLAEATGETQNPDVQRYQSLLPEFRGAVLHAMKTRAGVETQDFDSQIAEAEILLVTALNPSVVSYGYRKALAYARNDPEKLSSTLRNLRMLASLGYRTEFVQAGETILSDALEAIKEQGARPGAKKSLALLFAGQMVDSAIQEEPIFPAGMEPEVRERICARLDELHADETSTAVLTGLAAGSDIVFAEECLKRNMHLEVLLSCPEESYIEDWVAPFGGGWRQRYGLLREHPNIVFRQQLEEMGMPRMGDHATKRNMRWGVYTAAAAGPENTHLIVLWNGNDSRPRRADEYLIKDLIDQARSLGIHIDQINIRKFAYWKDH